MLDRVRTTWRSLRARHRWLAVAGDVQQRFTEVHGGYLASAVTLAAFLSVFPLLLVAVAVLGFFSHGHPDLAPRLLDQLGIPAQGDAADLIRKAINSAEHSRQAASVVGVAGLLWSGLGLVAAMQYAYNSTWQVRGRGTKGKGFGLLWLAGNAVLVAVTFGLTAAMSVLPGMLWPVEVALSIALGAVMFLWASKVLPNRDVGWRALLPGAVFGGVGFELLKEIGGIYVPRAVASSSALYGSIGVVFAILAWLFFFGRLLVYSSVLNVVLWERGHGTEVIDIRVPSLPQANREAVAT